MYFNDDNQWNIENIAQWVYILCRSNPVISVNTKLIPISKVISVKGYIGLIKYEALSYQRLGYISKTTILRVLKNKSPKTILDGIVNLENTGSSSLVRKKIE